MEDVLHDRMDVDGGAVVLLLVLHHELEELLCCHMLPSTGVPPERLPNVWRRFRLADFELTIETPEHLVIIVATHLHQFNLDAIRIRISFIFTSSFPFPFLAMTFPPLFSNTTRKLCFHACIYMICDYIYACIHTTIFIHSDCFFPLPSLIVIMYHELKHQIKSRRKNAKIKILFWENESYANWMEGKGKAKMAPLLIKIMKT